MNSLFRFRRVVWASSLVAALLACERRVVLGDDDVISGSGAAASGGRGGTSGGTGAGGLGAASPGMAVCGDGIPEGEDEQCDESGGTQSCTVRCQFRNRVTEGLVVYYTFQEGTGSQIFDRSGYGAPLNLTIPDAAAVAWGPASLDLVSPVLIASESSASKITEAVQVTSELTVETWIAPANIVQDGPARIVTISHIEYRRNVTLAQIGTQAVIRVRTSENDANGFPEFRAEDAISPDLVHLAWTRSSAGIEVLYVNGVEQVRRSLAGDFSTWDNTFSLGLGAEFNEELDSRDFLGTMHLVAMYSRALSEAEIVQNFDDGP